MNVCQLDLNDKCNPDLKPGVDICARGLNCSKETNRCEPTQPDIDEVSEILEQLLLELSDSEVKLIRKRRDGIGYNRLYNTIRKGTKHRTQKNTNYSAIYKQFFKRQGFKFPKTNRTSYTRRY